MPFRKTGNIHDGVTQTRVRKPRSGRGRRPLGRRQENYVRGIVNQKMATKGEKKVHDRKSASAAIEPDTGTPLVLDLSLVSQGTTRTERIGTVVSPQYLGIRGYIHTQATGQDFSSVRILVLQWRPDSVGDGPNWGKLLSDTAYPNGFYKKDRSGQFKILHDERLVFTQTRANPTCEKELDIQIKGNVMNDVNFNSGSSSGDNHLYFMAISDDVDASLTPPLLKKFFSRLIYTDN